MEHKGLVSRVEEDLERSIALGQWPRGTLASERMMARRYGVSRTTIRGALQGLAARGLIVRHPGRQSRTVALDQALTLESLKLALPEEGRPDPDRRRLLEGYFSLKREITVELLAACCEHASQEELHELGSACFALREEAHWQEDRKGWVRQEFKLLRMAARAVDRPGHTLLLQSLEKSFWGISERVLPHLDAGAIENWALFALHSLGERNDQALRQELPALLKAVDASLLDQLAPVRKTPTMPEPSPAPESSHPPVKEAVPGANGPNWSACHTSSVQARPTEGLPLQESPPLASTPGCSAPADSPAAPASSTWHGSSRTFGGALAPTHALPAGAAPSNGTDSALPPLTTLPCSPPAGEQSRVAAEPPAPPFSGGKSPGG